MLDQHTLISQMLLTMIELSERQQAQAVLPDMITAALSGLSPDMAAIAGVLGMGVIFLLNRLLGLDHRQI
jgi:hypothetical protein